MLTRREVEGELRSLGFRASARQRRAEREKAKRFAQGVLGVIFGVTLLALLGAVNLLHTMPGEIATGRSGGRAGASEWVSGNSGSQRRNASLFFTGRRTRHPDDPRGRNRHRSDD